MEMEATTIDQLFPDVLEEIFSHMSASDLINCALVCKDWNYVIGSSEATMKKFKIGFHLCRDCIVFGRERIMRNTDESYRNHQSMEIVIHDGSLTQLSSLDRFNVSQVKSLNLRFGSSERIELKKVVELVSRMPLLHLLMVEFNDECTFDTSNTPVEHFNKLKHLKMRHYPTDELIREIFDFIKADNVTELTLVNCAAPPDPDAEIDELAAFIKSKRSLSKLEITTQLFAQLHRRHDLCGMNLETLRVEGYLDDQPDIVVENIRKSLISNAHSLTSLSIHPRLMRKKVVLVIFNRLMKLTMLQIIGWDGSWMDDLSPNDIPHNLSLKTLNVHRVGAINGLKTILQRASQLKNLKLEDVTGGIMKEVATSAPGLVDLEIYSLCGSLYGDQRLIELKSLKISRFRNVGCLASLLERCPKIEDFEYGSFGDVDPYSLIDLLLQQITLKHLRFGCCWPAAERIIFNKLKANYGSLRSLEFRSASGKFIMFDFPENPAEWNVAQQLARLSDFQIRIRCNM